MALYKFITTETFIYIYSIHRKKKSILLGNKCFAWKFHYKQENSSSCEYFIANNIILKQKYKQTNPKKIKQNVMHHINIMVD